MYRYIHVESDVLIYTAIRNGEVLVKCERIQYKVHHICITV